MSSWWVSIGLIVLVCPAWADQVVAEGVGSIIGGDVAQARDEAIIDARVRALEQAVGVMVDSETLVQNELLLSATVRNTTSGMITSYQILEEGRDGDLYRVKISASVDRASLGEQIRRHLASNVSVIVMVDEEVVGTRVPDSVVESHIVETLLGAGFDVRDHQAVARLRRRDAELARARGEIQEAQIIGMRFLSNLVIKGTSRTTAHDNVTEYAPGLKLPSAHARVTCRMVDVETGRIVGQKQFTRVKAFGQDYEDASEKALLAAAPSVAAEVLKWFESEYLAERLQTLTLKARRLPDMAAFRRLVNLVEKERWVQNVQPGSFGEGEGTLTLRYPEKPVYLATRIDRSPQFRLVRMDSCSMVVEWEQP